MTIEVDLPDGSVAEFPDGTSPDVIKGALRRRFNMPPAAADAGMFKNAPGITGQAGNGPLTADAQAPNIGIKGDKVAGSRMQPDLGSTTLQGATLNLGDEITAGLAAIPSAVKNFVAGEGPTSIGENYDQMLANRRAAIEATREQRPAAALATEVGGALLTAKAPLGLMGKAPTLGNAVVRSGIAGAGMGAVAGFGAGEGTEGRLENGGTGALIGGPVGALAPVVGALLSRAVTPFKTSAARTQAANVLRNEGVDVTAGQRTGSHALRYAESELGGQKAAGMMERQGEQFTAAALKKAGITADRATPDVIDDAYTRIGREFDGLASRNALEPDQKMISDLQGAVQDYASLVPQTYRAPVIQNVVSDILQTVSLRGPNGTNAIQGSSYQALRSTLDRAARGTNDPHLARALREIKDTLDDAMERSIAKNNPADAGAWRDVRRQYRNMLVLEKAATGAGENAAMGLISPSHLRNAAVNQSRRGYARGKGDFADLARAGEALMKPLPNSGTPGRTAVRALGTSVPALLGAGGGASVGGPLGAIAGSVAGAALPKVVGALMMSKAGQAYLSNQVAASPALRNVVSALITSGAAGRLPTP